MSQLPVNTFYGQTRKSSKQRKEVSETNRFKNFEVAVYSKKKQKSKTKTKVPKTVIAEESHTGHIDVQHEVQQQSKGDESPTEMGLISSFSN